VGWYLSKGERAWGLALWGKLWAILRKRAGQAARVAAGKRPAGAGAHAVGRGVAGLAL